MKAVGIICEYNPFHLGHLRQFHMIRKILGNDTAIICVMSGNYVQRGLPAMWDKSVRAEAALACGADLVLELPITGVLQSAEGFAQTGVTILNQLGCVDYICFGAECGSAEALMDLAQKMETPAYEDRLHAALDQGLPYAAARQSALDCKDELLHSPNNILGLEYCRALLRTNSSMKPFAVQRNGSYHATEADADEPSATAVRTLFPNGSWSAYIPNETVSILQAQPWYDIAYGERAILARLRGLSNDDWEACAHGSEGLWSKAMKASRSESSLEAIIQATKSKRYPRTRIQRLLLCAYLGISANSLKAAVPYIRILGATPAGRSLLRSAKDAEHISLVNAGQTPPDVSYYRLECMANDLFTLFAAPAFEPICGNEQHRKVILTEKSCS